MAYVVTRYDIKGKKIINILVILSLMSPPFIGAYAWIMLFGRSGFVTQIVQDWFGITLPTIYGKWGIISVFTMKMYPYVYLFTSGAMGSIDASLEEAAENLGASKWQRLKDITIPVVMPSILAGAVMVFTSCISDFGTPMLIGQNYKVLASLVYEQYMSEIGTSSNFAAAVSMVVIALPALILVLCLAVLIVYFTREYSMSKVEDELVLLTQGAAGVIQRELEKDEESVRILASDESLARFLLEKEPDQDDVISLNQKLFLITGGKQQSVYLHLVTPDGSILHSTTGQTGIPDKVRSYWGVLRALEGARDTVPRISSTATATVPSPSA